MTTSARSSIEDTCQPRYWSIPVEIDINMSSVKIMNDVSFDHTTAHTSLRYSITTGKFTISLMRLDEFHEQHCTVKIVLSDKSHFNYLFRQSHTSNWVH